MQCCGSGRDNWQGHHGKWGVYDFHGNQIKAWRGARLSRYKRPSSYEKISTHVDSLVAHALCAQKAIRMSCNWMQSMNPGLQVHVYDQIVDAGDPGVKYADGGYIKAW